jgi:hypothetical protein
MNNEQGGVGFEKSQGRELARRKCLAKGLPEHDDEYDKDRYKDEVLPTVLVDDFALSCLAVMDGLSFKQVKMVLERATELLHATQVLNVNSPEFLKATQKSDLYFEKHLGQRP